MDDSPRTFWRWTALTLAAIGLATAAWLHGAGSSADNLEQQISATEAAIRTIHAERSRRQHELAVSRLEFEDIPDVLQALERGYADAEPVIRRVEDEMIASHRQTIAQLKQRACRERQQHCGR